MSLRSLMSMPRMLRHGSAVGADLPPDEAVTVDAVTDPALCDALSAAALGDAAPARELLAETRLGAQWERRSNCVSALATSALRHPGWLENWLDTSPDDPDATLLTAGLRVQRAWQVRTGEDAGEISDEQFRVFFSLLEEAVPMLSAATELNPTDPVPWEIALTHARGIQSPRDVFDSYWSEAVARAPHHFGCHASALQYLCEKWYGSHTEMFDFAERAADRALPGSLLNALPLLAAIEYEVVSPDPPETGPITRGRLASAVARALELSSWYEPGDPEAAEFRNHLALMLIFDQRWQDALEMFRAIGVHAREFPWAYLGESRKEFLEFRLGVRMQVASSTPFFGKPPQPAPPPEPEQIAAESDGVHRSLAIVPAAPDRVAEAALMCGVSLRIAPAPWGAGQDPAGEGRAEQSTGEAEGGTDAVGRRYPADGEHRGEGPAAFWSDSEPPGPGSLLWGAGPGIPGAGPAAWRTGGPPLPAAPPPSSGARLSYVEVAPDLFPNRRTGAATGEELLTTAVAGFTTGEPWPALVLHHAAGRHGFALFGQGTVLASHQWDPAAPVLDHPQAAAVARALASAFPPAGPRPLITLLRGGDDPARRQRQLLAALGLPPLPNGFGERDDILKDAPGAQLVLRRGVLKGIRDSMRRRRP
ncbi:hypothetical protein [Streptomyces sp. NPDC005953]|uniref:hypothetical protein n=1 Tax=Streptomyces sp. NPDC005953 TaxID=3156719 RepID=UPI0033FA5D85